MSENATNALVCRRPDCKVGENGRCAEGVTPASECKNTKPEEPTDSIATENAAELEEGSAGDLEPETFDPAKHVHLHSGRPLSVAEASSTLDTTNAVVVSFVGFKDAGKTSLFSSIHNRLQFGPIDGQSFVRSDTIMAFEERCHDTRVASGRTEPVTPRTQRQGDPSYLHLTLTNGGEVRTFLFVDRSGEDFRDATNDTTRCANLVEFRRADAVVVLVDGEKIALANERHAALANCGALVQTLLDNGVLGSLDIVDVVLSKIDAIASAAGVEDTAARAAYENFKTNFVSRFGGRVAQLRFWEIAACPKKGALKVGHGVAELLASWKPNSRKLQPPTRSRSATDISNLLQFERFCDRYFAGLESQAHG